jgi:hypothetical protein
MGTEIKVWQLSEGKLTEIQEDELAASHHEKTSRTGSSRTTRFWAKNFWLSGGNILFPGSAELICCASTKRGR